MKKSDLTYANLVTLIKPYTDKGRPISIAFLDWFLEHIYRTKSLMRSTRKFSRDPKLMLIA